MQVTRLAASDRRGVPVGPEQLVLGLAGTVDYELRWNTGRIQELVRRWRIKPEELSTAAPIDDERGLLIAILGFIAGGHGGERYIASSALAERFSARFDKRITLGGTCVRAAIAMDMLGIASTLHLVSIDDNVRRLLPASSKYLLSGDHDTTDPHVIIQYPAGVAIEVGALTVRSASPNRIIFANDPPHLELRISSQLPAALAKARLFLISSFNVIQDRAILLQRLATVRRAMASMAPSAVAMYEDAGFHNPALSDVALEQLGSSLDVVSMNEDELQGHVGHRVVLSDPAAVAAAVTGLRTKVAAATIVVHTRDWALSVGREAKQYMAALQGGVDMASARYVHGDAVGAGDYPPRGFSRSAAGLDVARRLPAALAEPACCVAGYELPATRAVTIGLGDAFVGGFIAAWAKEHHAPAVCHAESVTGAAVAGNSGAMAPTEEGDTPDGDSSF
jgi:ADP-dependent phosphofructokinase/glucokinase